MKENFLVDLSKQFAVDIVNLCTDIKKIAKAMFYWTKLYVAAQA